MKPILFFIIALLNTVVFANVVITFAGDLNASVIPKDKKDSDKVFNSVRNIMKNDDFTIVNLECPISVQGKAMENKKFTFRAKPSVAKILHDNGIDAVSIANNHALDFGKDAFLDTLKNLEENNIIFGGGGINANKTINPSIKIKTTTINFFAASRVLPDTNWVATNNRAGLLSAYNPDKLLLNLKNARKNDRNFIVAYIHWGEEKAVKPNKIQITLAHQLIDAGADVVIGTHPHVLQGFEWYKGKLIAYSMGNFIFSCSARTTMMIQLKIDKNKVIGIKVIPLILSKKIPVVIKKEQTKQQVYKYLTGISINSIVDDNGNIQQGKNKHVKENNIYSDLSTNHVKSNQHK